MDSAVGRLLRPVPEQPRPADPAGPPDDAQRAGCVVRTDRKLGQVVHRRPSGVTPRQWNSATRTHLDFVVCDAATLRPVFAVEFDDPDQPDPDRQRNERMKRAVCAAVGLELLTIESATLRPDRHGRRIVDYLVDARAYHQVITGGLAPEASDPMGETIGTALGYRDIVGRLPDGRTGFVNDLGALARVMAVEAYVDRRLVDPILRGLHVRWQDGPAEGWGWVDAGTGRCLFERVRLWRYGFSCGVDLGRLAEDLAATAIGERLRGAETDHDLVVHDKNHLTGEFERLTSRRHEMEGGFGFDHVLLDQAVPTFGD